MKSLFSLIAGLVERTMYPAIPPRVEYRLTDLGLSLIEPLRALHAWVASHHSSIRAAGEAFDMQKDENAAHRAAFFRAEVTMNANVPFSFH